MEQGTGFSSTAVNTVGTLIMSTLGEVETCTAGLAEAVGLTSLQADDKAELKRLLLSAKGFEAGTPTTGIWTAHGRSHTIEWIPFEDGRWLGEVRRTGEHHVARAQVGIDRLDPLTAMLTRSYLMESFAALRQRAQGEGTDVFALFLDLDRFKQINDTLGHDIGDKLLKTVASRMRQCGRENNILFRIGGDEFAVFGSAREAAKAAEMLATRMIERISRPYLIEGHQILIGASVGLAVAQPDEMVQELLRRADLALYESKRSGRGRFSWFDNTLEDAVEARRTMDIALRRALALGALEVHFQPRVRIADGIVVGFEALTCWKQDDGTLVAEDKFMYLAEETQLILRIGDFVRRKAIEVARAWPDNISITVNVSSVELRYGSLPQTIHQILEDTGFDRSRLEIQLKSSVIFEASTVMVSTLKALHALGICISIERLGEVGSPLNILNTFPFSSAKVDKSLVRDGPHKGNAAAIEAIARLVSTTGAALVAEGVETAPELAYVVNHGCIEAQGLLLGEPMSQQDVIKLLRGHNHSNLSSTQESKSD